MLIFKFYFLQLIITDDAYYIHTRWGRVGEFGQVKTMGPFDEFDHAMKEFDKKFKDKTGLKWEDRFEEPRNKKYTFLEKNYESDGEDGSNVKKEEDDDDQKPNQVPSNLPKQTQRLMELIFNENHFNSVLESIGYNQEKLPLGKLGKSTIQAGFKHLKELASLIKHPSLSQNKYGISQKEVRDLPE
jgi:poly [ADP-ribose] polymerase 2/3/4